MKNLLFFLCLFFLVNQSFAQLILKKGDLVVGLKVTKDDKIIPIDSLCSGFDPITNAPLNFVVPEGSSVGFIRDSMIAENVTLMLNNTEPNYLNQPKQKKSGFSRSSSPGSINRYTFIDNDKNDSLRIEWMVSYDPVKLLDLYPANYFTDYISYTFQNIFEKYPDTVRYDWSGLDYIQNLDERGLPIEPALPYNHEGLLFVIYISEDAVIKMNGYHDKFHKIDTEKPFELLLYNDLAPGAYEFIAKPYADAPEKLWLKYPFTIEVPWWQTGKMKVFTGIMMVGLIAMVIILYLIRSQKRKEKEMRWQQQLTEAELKAIRAQLNPHFLFNALNSIQNLVNQQENEKANQYITKLSRLLRQVLSSSERQFQELEDELKLTHLYLELEQLRFPFTFDVNMDQSVDKHSLVPVMLLQPYVENAVKHGVAGKTDGVITINIKKQKDQLHFEILDNGPGLSTLSNTHSKGLQLGKHRIHHLNNLYLDQASVSIKNRAHQNGVIVIISLPTE